MIQEDVIKAKIASNYHIKQLDHKIANCKIDMEAEHRKINDACGVEWTAIRKLKTQAAAIARQIKKHQKRIKTLERGHRKVIWPMRDLTHKRRFLADRIRRLVKQEAIASAERLIHKQHMNMLKGGNETSQPQSDGIHQGDT